MLISDSLGWLLILRFGLVCALSENPPDSGSSNCSTLHTIVVRASEEPPGYGIMESLAQDILDNVPGSTSEAIVYPALLEPYNESSYAGVVATTKQLQSRVNECPKGKVILLGYSQVFSFSSI